MPSIDFPTWSRFSAVKMGGGKKNKKKIGAPATSNSRCTVCLRWTSGAKLILVRLVQFQFESIEMSTAYFRLVPIRFLRQTERMGRNRFAWHRTYREYSTWYRGNVRIWRWRVSVTKRDLPRKRRMVDIFLSDIRSVSGAN